jgi:hypothetical protein
MRRFGEGDADRYFSRLQPSKLQLRWVLYLKLEWLTAGQPAIPASLPFSSRAFYLGRFGRRVQTARPLQSYQGREPDRRRCIGRDGVRRTCLADRGLVLLALLDQGLHAPAFLFDLLETLGLHVDGVLRGPHD